MCLGYTIYNQTLKAQEVCKKYGDDVLDDLKLLHERDAQDLLGATERQLPDMELLRVSAASWAALIPTKRNLAKQIALECLGRSIVIYSGPALAPAAQAWKMGFNRHAKQLAWAAELSVEHDAELLGWTKQPVDKPYAVIDLRSNLDAPAVQQRFVAAERLLSGLRPAPLIVEVQGETIDEQVSWATALGDFVTIYTALLNSVNPASADFLIKFKQLLDEA
jgi:hypothetical protein